MPKPKTHRIVVYKIRSGFSIDDISPAGYEEKLSEEGKRLWIKTAEKEPQWKHYLAPLLSENLQIKNSTNSFILLQQKGDHLYALAGGSGYHGLKDFAEQDFGLQVAVRMISDDDIASLNQKPLRGSVRQVFRTVQAYDPAHDSDNYNRMLKLLQGKGEFEGRTFTISGRSSLVLRTIKSVNSLEDVFSEIEEILERDERVNIPKTFEIVSDEETIETLEEQLHNTFTDFWENNGSRDSLYLDFPDVLDQVHAAKFIIKCQRKTIELEDFDLVSMRDLLIAEGITSASEVLNKARILAYNDDDTLISQIKSVQRNITFDTEIGTDSYLKLDSEWIHILDDVKSYIDEQISNIPIDRNYMPDWNHTDEQEYNAVIAQQEQWDLMDRQCVTIQGHSRIELCDLYDPTEARFIHVKKTWASKATYLFLQATTAAVTYADYQEFRERCQEKFPTSFDGTRAGGETIVIAMAITDAQLQDYPNNLSYFAKYNLHRAVSDIRNKDYNVILAPIKLVN